MAWYDYVTNWGPSGALNNRAAYGTIPQLPDPTAASARAVAAAGGLAPALTNLAKLMGGASAAGAKAQYTANLPNYEAMMKSATDTALANLRGEVAPDVKANLWRGGAERGIASGLGPDSPNIDAAYLQALGLTSRDQQILGQQQLDKLIADMPKGPAFDPSKFLTTPSDIGQRDVMQSIYNAMPDPYLAAMAALSAANYGRGGGGYGGYGGYAPATTPVGGSGAYRGSWGQGTLTATSTGNKSYPGYHWDEAQGTYVQDAYTPAPGTYTGGPGGQGWSFMGDPATSNIDVETGLPFAPTYEPSAGDIDPFA